MLEVFRDIGLLNYICEEQFSIMLAMFQAYVAFMAIINAVMILLMGNAISSNKDYKKTDKLVYEYCGIKRLQIVTLIVLVVMILILAVHSCSPQRMWTVISFPVFFLVVLAMLVRTISLLHRYTESVLPIEEMAKQRIERIIREDVNRKRTTEDRSNYAKECGDLKEAIEKMIILKEYTPLREALRWFNNVVFEELAKSPEIGERVDLYCYACDTVQALSIEAAAQRENCALD